MGLTRIRAEQISDIDYKQAVRVITVANVTLSGGAPSTVDGVNLLANDRILVTGQDTASENGLYRVATLGTGSNGTWTRTADSNATGEIEAGMIVMVTEGVIYKDTSWKLTTNDPIVVGTTALTFEQNTGVAFGNIYANGTAILSNTASGTVTLAAGDNIAITGNNTTKTITIGVSGLSTSNISNGTTSVNIATANGNVTMDIGGSAAIATVSSAGVDVLGRVSATGNITGNYFIGNGSQLTGLPAGYANANVVAYGEAGWAGNIIPSANVTYDLGTSSNRWKDIWLSNSTIYLGNAKISANATSLVFTNPGGGNTVLVGASPEVSATTVSATGNITGSYFIGNGSQLTGIDATQIQSGNSNVKIASESSNVTISVNNTSNVVVVTTAGGIVTGSWSATDTLTAANLVSTNNITGTLATPTQINITEVGTLGSLSVTGNIQTGNLQTGGTISATGNITGAHISGNGIPTTTVANSAPSSPEQGDIWINSDSGIQYIYFTASGNSQWAQM